MKLHRMQCFGRTDKSGNTALVVEHSALTEAERLMFAQQQDANATVFVDVDPAGQPQLDYYYPHARSPLCLHATLAAGAIMFRRQPDTEQVRFVTSMHRQTLEVERDDQMFFVGAKGQTTQALTVDVARTAELLRANPVDLVGISGPASVGSPKLLVEVANESILNALRPNLAGIADWSRQHGVSGIYVYCLVRDGVYAGRNFNHLDPRFEDAATGVAAGALALTLKRSITLLQGDGLGKPCTLVTRYTSNQIQIGGRAVSSAR